MPFIKSKVSCEVSLEKELELKTLLGQAIEIIPGKSEQYLLLEFEDIVSWSVGGQYIDRRMFR